MTRTLRRSMLIAMMITAAYTPNDSRSVRAADDAAEVKAMPDLTGRWRLVTRRQKTNETIDFRRSKEPTANFEFDVPVVKSQRTYQLKWIDSSKHFETTTNFSLSLKDPPEQPLPGKVTFAVTVNSAQELRMKIELDDTAKTALAERSREPRPDELTLENVSDLNEELARSTWKKIPGSEGVLVHGVAQLADPTIDKSSSDASTSSVASEPSTSAGTPVKDPSLVPKKPSSIESTDLIIKETKDGLSGYSKLLGKWDRIVTLPPKNGSTRLEHATVGSEFASVLIDDQVFGFSSKAGRWGQLTIPPQFRGKAIPQVGAKSLLIRLGDEIYALSPTTGQWMSSDGTPAETKQTVGFTYLGISNSATTETSNREKLAESIAEYEKLIAMFATEIRELVAKQPLGEKDAIRLDQLRRKMKIELANVFDMTAQLEKIRVKELQSRLSQLEQQIGQRQSQRDQIIERRARELIEGDATKWSSDDINTTASPTAANKPAVSKLQKTGDDAGEPRRQDSTQVLIRFTDELPGVTPSIEYEGTVYQLPARLNFERGEKEFRHYALRLLVDAVEIQRPLRLDIYPATPNSTAFLSHNSVKFEISLKEAKATLQNEAKIVFLPDAKFQELAIADVRSMIVTGNTDPGFVFTSADRDGTPLAALTLLASISEPTRSESEVMRDSMISNPPTIASTSPSYKQWATDFETVEHELGTAEIKLNYTKALVAQKVVSPAEAALPQKDFDTAQRKLEILKTALKAELRDLELQISSDKAELAAASLAKDAVAAFPHTQDQVYVATRRWEQAKVTSQRRNLQYNMLHELATRLKLATSDRRPPQALDHDVQSQIHSRWKMRLGSPAEPELVALAKTKYRGGLRVERVDQDGPAARNGIKEGDILVGLDKWETMTLDNINWVMFRKTAVEPEDQIKFFVIRGTETKFGTLPLNDPNAQSDGEPRRWYWGMRLAKLDEKDQDILSKSKFRSGLRITEIEPDSPAAKSSIQVGDILVGLDMFTVSTFDQINWIARTPAAFGKLDRLGFRVYRLDHVEEGTLSIHSAAPEPAPFDILTRQPDQPATGKQ